MKKHDGFSIIECCESSCLHVAGSFYTYRDQPDNLHEGYPC